MSVSAQPSLFLPGLPCAGVSPLGAALAYEAQAVSHGAGWAALRWLAWGVAALHLIMTAWVWAATLRTLGISSLRVCPRMLRLSLRAAPIREVTIAALLPLVVALPGLCGIGPAFLAELPFGAVLFIALLYFTRLPVPPVVLVFASSTDEQLRWALDLKKFTDGRRVISLLDTEYMQVRPAVGDVVATVLRRSNSLTDVLRVSDGANWHDGVRELIEITPIVVVDTRVCTEALLFEASSVLTPRYAHKAVFVSDDAGACPVLERLLDEGRLPPGRAVNAVKEGELGQLLSRLVASSRTLPRPGRFVTRPLTIGGEHSATAGRRVLKRRAAPPPVTVPAGGAYRPEAPRPDERTVLSTRLTSFWLLTALGVIPYLIATTAVVVLLTRLTRTSSDAMSNVMWVLLGLNWAAGPLYFYLAYPLKKVSVNGDTLFVSNYRKEITIPISQLSRVSGPDWTGLRRITLHLRQPSAFGRKIIFAGRFFIAGKIARELRRRLCAVGAEAGPRAAARSAEGVYD